MELSALQQRVADFVRAHQLEAPAPSRLLDLTSEVGELAKEALKATSYGRAAFRAGGAWSDELGDVFFTLICLANGTDVDLEAALTAALEKYDRRLAGRGDAGSGP